MKYYVSNQTLLYIKTYYTNNTISFITKLNKVS